MAPICGSGCTPDKRCCSARRVSGCSSAWRGARAEIPVSQFPSTCKPKEISMSVFIDKTSSIRLFGLPLYDIASGRRHARGIFAVGRVATGVFAVGVVARGIFAAGVVSLGLLSAGVASVGALAVGTASLGAISAGAVTVGY